MLTETTSQVIVMKNKKQTADASVLNTYSRVSASQIRPETRGKFMDLMTSSSPGAGTSRFLSRCLAPMYPSPNGVANA